MRISDWSSDVCSSDLSDVDQGLLHLLTAFGLLGHQILLWLRLIGFSALRLLLNPFSDLRLGEPPCPTNLERGDLLGCGQPVDRPVRYLQELCDLLEVEDLALAGTCRHGRTEEHTSELQSLKRIYAAIFCLNT